MNEAVLRRSPMVPHSLLSALLLPLTRSPSSAADGSGSPAGHVVLTASLRHRGGGGGGGGVQAEMLCACVGSVCCGLFATRKTTATETY